jgi:hypothetical protein
MHGEGWAHLDCALWRSGRRLGRPGRRSTGVRLEGARLATCRLPLLAGDGSARHLHHVDNSCLDLPRLALSWTTVTYSTARSCSSPATAPIQPTWLAGWIARLSPSRSRSECQQRRWSTPSTLHSLPTRPPPYGREQRGRTRVLPRCFYRRSRPPAGRHTPEMVMSVRYSFRSK